MTDLTPPHLQSAPMLFVGGPYHGHLMHVTLVEAASGEHVVPGTVTHIESATSYALAKVDWSPANQQPRTASGSDPASNGGLVIDVWEHFLYMHESCVDLPGDQGPRLLTDAGARAYFMGRGTRVERPAKAASRLILPGQH